jgi:peptide/nickel transport system permease protein
MAMMPAYTPVEPVGPSALTATGPGQGRTGGRAALARLTRAVRSNRKATAGTVLLVIFVLVALFPGVIAHDPPNAEIYARTLGPSGRHLLGTTALGQDIFAQAIFGTRQVLIIAIGVGLFSTAVAVLIGVAAAYLGGLWDGGLNLLTDVLLVIPLFPLLIVIATYVQNAGTAVLVVVLTLTGWSYTARQLRAQALSLRHRDFLEAARVRGERRLYIILVEIIPTMTSLIVASFLTNALYAVLFGSSLQFIGLGDPNTVSWGTMLYWAENNEALQTGQYLWAVVPGLLIVTLGAAFALMNYAFDEIGNPALRPVRKRARRVRGLAPGKPAGTDQASAAEFRSSGAASAANGQAAAGARSSGDAILEVRDLSVTYAMERGTVIAVDRVSLDVAPGEFVGIVGESGCGKSTLLFAIAQLLAGPAAVTGGSVVFKGQSLVGLTDSQLASVRWKNLSVVMQSAMNALNPVKSIGAQYKDAMRAHGTASRQEIADRSAEVLKMVGIDPAHLKSYPHQLSGGMRQRAMIAMAMLFTPDLIIMDEPTSALDVVAQRSLMVQIKELQQQFGFAVLFVTHDMSLVSHFSDRLLVMYAGQVAELGVTRDVFDAPLHPYTAGLMEAFPSIRGPRVELSGIPGSPPDLSRPPAGCRFAARCPRETKRCTSTPPGLYQIGSTQVRCLLHEHGRNSGITDPDLTGDDTKVAGAGEPVSEPTSRSEQ